MSKPKYSSEFKIMIAEAYLNGEGGFQCIAGHQGKATAEAGRINRGKGADKGSGTRSSLMWETIHIIEQMGEWKPRYVIWENVKNVLSRYMRVNFNRYLSEMQV